MSRLTLFGVRHHSPQAARLVRDLIADLQPAAVLVEGPADYGPHVAELGLDHRLPIAIYSSAVVDGQRLGAYHPFCVHSPEWQAIRAGLAGGADVRLIDLPWFALADPERDHNGYADGALRASDGLPALLERLGVDDFDDAWDLLVEVDPAMSLDVYTQRVEALCGELRGDDEDAVPAEDRRREAFMAAGIRDALAAVDGPVIAVVGGFHVPGLRRRLAGPEEPAEPLEPARDGDGRVVALTPYAHAALDALTGYRAGMPSPGFYDLAWTARTAGGPPPADAALEQVVRRLRALDRRVSPADLIALRTTAGALARLRGHPEVWRRDLVDGILGALVKDELEAGVPHPILAACLEVLRGDAVGALADGARRPPLVDDLDARLDRLGLRPGPRPRTVTLDLRDPEDLERSRLLHATVVLALPGFTARDVASRPEDGTLGERWELRAAIELAGAAVEAAAYGPTVPSAVGARLLERAGRLQRDAAGAAALLRDAVLAGATGAWAPLRARVALLLGGDPDVGSVATAAAALLHLYRYEPVLPTVGDADIGALLGAAYDRLSRLLDPDGGSLPPEDDGVDGIVRAVEVLERAGVALELSRDALVAVLARLGDAPAARPGLRGAALGARWTLDAVPDAAIDAAPAAFADPDDLGAFLFGLFRVAREASQRRPELLRAVDALVVGWPAERFVDALPALRRAFGTLAPREKDRAARIVLGADLPPGPATGDPEELARLEAELARRVARYGLRGAA